MFFSIICALMVLLVAMMAVRQGFFSAAIMFVESVVACMLAFGLYEGAYGLVSESISPGLGEPLFFMLIFAVSLAAMRLATDKLIPGNVRMNRFLDYGGAALFGFFTGEIVVGTAVIAIQMMPIGREVFGFDRYEVIAKGELAGRVKRNTLMFKPDDFTIGMIEMFSAPGRFGSETPFGVAKPDLIDTLYSQRSQTQTEDRYMVPQKSLEVLGCWVERKIDTIEQSVAKEGLVRTFKISEADEGKKFLVCRIRIKPNAANEKPGDIRFRVQQFRVAGPRPPAEGVPTQPPHMYLAIGMTDIYTNDKHAVDQVKPDQVRRLVRFGPQTGFSLSQAATGAVAVTAADEAGVEQVAGYDFDVAFEVPEDFQPWYMEFKRRARFDFPNEADNEIFLKEPPQDASMAMGAGKGGPASGNQPLQITGGPKGRTHIANAIEERTGILTELPLVLDANDGNLANAISPDKKFRGGHVWVNSPTELIPDDSKVTEFYVPPDKKLLQVGAEKNLPASLIGRALGFATDTIGQIFVRDADGTEYFAIGVYTEAPVGGTRILEIQYQPDHEFPERALQKPKKLTKSVLSAAKPEERKMGYMFIVPSGVSIVSFHAGGRNGESQTFNPPIAVP